jgi:hypothetical protein
MDQAYPTDLTPYLVYEGGPPAEIVRELLHALFFASMEPEEGRYQPIGLVYAPQLSSLQSAVSPWDAVLLREAQPFERRRVVKMAGATTFAESLLIVSWTPFGLALLGFATPRDRTIVWDRDDRLLRLLAPRPGIVVGAQGAGETVRYERGTIVLSKRESPFDIGPHRRQLDSIRRAALSRMTTQVESSTLVSQFQEIIGRVAASGHGGLLAILPPDAVAGECCDGAKWLSPPLPLGALLDEAYACSEEEYQQEHSMLSIEAEGLDLSSETRLQLKQKSSELERAAKKADSAVERAISQLVSMMGVDGAVICSHSLEVLAFGAKLHAREVEAFEVAILEDGVGPGEKWTASGTRHRAAAYFASKYPDGIAFVVSQDGHAAVFQDVDGAVVYWPLRLFFFKEFPWSWV